MRHLRGITSSVFFGVGDSRGNLVRRGGGIHFGNGGGSGEGEYRRNGSHGCLGALSFI
jgi:hypothetical protein